MSWEPKRYDPPGHDDGEPEGCPDCRWKDWEKLAWTYYGTAIVILLVFIIVGVGAHKP